VVSAAAIVILTLTATRAAAQEGGTQDAPPVYSVLYTFTGGADGAHPQADLIADAAGNLYGTTFQGGNAGAGVVFKLDGTGNETVLYSFAGGADGANPIAGLVSDSDGNLYGTTNAGGGSCACGVVFKLDPSGNETVLHTFAGGPDGAFPMGDLVRDAAGNLYGTTNRGGGEPCSCGAIFKLNGLGPLSRLIMDAAGNLYGTTKYGRTQCGYNGLLFGCGVVFKLDPAGNETVLHAFNIINGQYPYAGVVQDEAGNLYGTTFLGGNTGGGLVFKLDPSGNEAPLHLFAGGAFLDGAYPDAGLLLYQSSLYGTTSQGGQNDNGVVFKVTLH
jgi:uncharacterized repeat protein (TIGR03803 family)